MMSATTASFQVVEELLCISFSTLVIDSFDGRSNGESVPLPNVLSRLIMCDSRDLTLHALL